MQDGAPVILINPDPTCSFCVNAERNVRVSPKSPDAWREPGASSGDFNPVGIGSLARGVDYPDCLIARQPAKTDEVAAIRNRPTIGSVIVRR